MSAADAAAMDHALRLARRGLGRTWPNPSVGCVIVREGRVVGRGVTAPGGRPHAETEALSQAGAAATGATAFVTLEPCAHEGETGPCATALAEAGIARVVSAMEDPDPRVAGKGHALLRAAGIAVEIGPGAAAAARLNAGFLKRVTRGLPFVTLKLAASLDGRIATRDGESRWITGAEARRRVHLMRMTHDAVLIGAGTALADDPDLRVRDLGAAHQPVRIVLDSRLSLDPASRLGQSARAAPVWLLHGGAADADRLAAWTATGARPVAVETAADGQVRAEAALRMLAAMGITRILCEGGARLAASLLCDGLVDQTAVFSAGLTLGGDGQAAVGLMGIGSLADAPRATLAATERWGADILHLWDMTPGP
jgi:diaminohydroxyphosphoribosylaminopyrimidine deaminase / 5-amino-6-(5-phosphoribosylamino)uracil reductase